MNNDAPQADLTSGALAGCIDYSSLDVLRSEILSRKRVNRVENVVSSQPLRTKQQRKDKDKAVPRGKQRKECQGLTDEEYQKSRNALMAKASLYDKLSSGDVTPIAEEDSPFLVDFEKKYFASRKNSVFSTFGEKVEFVDKFGRTRQCDRQSLSEFKGLSGPCIYDDDVEDKGKEEKKRSATDASIDFCNDQYREKLRQKWQNDMDIIAESRDVHYEHVKFDEVREMGAGYFAFSRDEKERAKQLQRFKEMRRATLLAQERMVVEKLQRQSQLSERLRRVRKNRGITAHGTEDRDEIARLVMASLVSAVEQIVELREQVTRQLNEANEAATRSTSSQRWPRNESALITRRTEQLRAERYPDFAPPRSL